MSSNGNNGFFRRLSYNIGLVIIVLMFVFFSLVSDFFLSIPNVLNILHHGAILGTLALGVTYIIILGEMDISFANLMSFASVLVAIFLRYGYSSLVSIVFATAISVLLGTANGFFVGYRRYSSIAVTLATSNLFLGLNYTVSKGRPIYAAMPDTFLAIGQNSIIGVPISVILLIIVSVVTYFIIHATSYGQKLYAVGSDQDSARVMGINVRLVKLVAFITASIYVAISAVISTSRLGSGQPIVGSPYFLETLAAVFFGKAISRQNVSTVIGTLTGTVVLSILFNGVTLLGLPSYIYQLVLGLVLIFAMLATIKGRTKMV